MEKAHSKSEERRQAIQAEKAPVAAPAKVQVEFFFPGVGEFPGVTITASSREEAETKLAAIRSPKE
jgi:hypothetical protein